MNSRNKCAGLPGLQALCELLDVDLTPSKYTDHTASALDNPEAILSHIFSGDDTDDLFVISAGSVDHCYHNDATGRLLWIYRLPANPNLYPTFIDNPCRTFIIELNFDDKATHSERTEHLIRQKVGDTFVPKRLKTQQMLVDGKYNANITVYETVNEVRNLSQLWKSNMKSVEYQKVVKDLVDMKRTLCFIAPPESDFTVFEDPQAQNRKYAKGPILHPTFDFSKWNISCDKEYHKRDPAVLCDAKPVLALLNRHLPGDRRGEAVVANDGSSITLHLADSQQGIVFTAKEMKYLRQNTYLHHPMIDFHDVFIQGTGKDCHIVAVLGWETAEYCTSGYGMGLRDAMLGKEIKDNLWYLCLRREGLKRRKAKNALSEPAQIKMVDAMHMVCSFRDPATMTNEVSESMAKRSKWLLQHKYKWKGGRIGWHSTWLTEFKNIFRERLDYALG
jgi:hypothetical protein